MSAKKVSNLKAKQNSDILAARYVIEREIEGLKALFDSLDGDFSKAVDLIISLDGRLVLSGMGKSGHIARKVASTLASTGTPALFVHPGEASHGDLGMVTTKDAVVLFSNSGETKELSDIISYCRRFSIPMIAVVRKKTSTLVNSADIAFILPDIEEASPTGAPTTSTTMMLAWGDALAIALLKRRGFGKDDFHVFHPGGKLGSGLVKVEQLMKTGKKMPLVMENAFMSEAIIEMSAKSLGCTGVVNKSGRLLGVITDGDLRRNMGKNLINLKVLDVMTKNPLTISSGSLAVEAVNLMNKKSITSLFVVDKNKLMGIIHIHDLLRLGVA